MNYTIWQLTAYFFLYSILGWAALATVRSLRDGRFVNFGLLNGPIYPSCGAALTLCIWLVRDKAANYVWEYFLCLMVCMASHATSKRIGEQVAGRSLRGTMTGWFAFLGRADFYVQGLILSLLCVMTIHLVHPLVFLLVDLLPLVVLKVLDWCLLGIFAVDLISSGLLFHKLRNKNSRLQTRVSEELGEARETWGDTIARTLKQRLYRAYPEMEASAAEEGGLGHPDETRVFAKGYGLTKMFWVFFLCALIGDLVETIYCRCVGGQWMSRSSFLYGPFSMVWGGGAALGVAILEPLSKKNDRWTFLGGFILGGAYEYLCSVVTEVLFGKVFWDYSDYPLNIGGRTNVLYMFFWGVAAVILIKLIYPCLSAWIERIPPLPGMIITWLLVAFMVLDGAVSVLAMGRYAERSKNPAVASQIDVFLDTRYPDSLVETRWQNMVSVQNDGTENTQ